MFISYQVKECSNCGNVMETIHQIDKKISLLSDNLYNNYAYMTTLPCSNDILHDLVIYKGMLKKLLMNPKYYIPFTTKDVISKAKTLI